MKETVKLFVNNQHYEVDIDPKTTLLTVLRQHLGLLGAKPICLTGDCGACNVIVDETAVPSCLIQAKKVEGKPILTIEGLAENGRLDPIQESFINHGAVQCGICIPGAIMSAKALLDKHPNPDEQQIRKALARNICRCGCYIEMVDAIQAAAELRKKRI